LFASSLFHLFTLMLPSAFVHFFTHSLFHFVHLPAAHCPLSYHRSA
jgi:hypothetical protein